MRVPIAHAHAVVRLGLRQILLDEFGALEVGEAADAHETLRLAHARDWALVVLDISMPGRSGLEVLKELKQTRPRLPVLILTTYPEEQYAVRVLKAGAAGYMTTESAPEHLVEAVRRVTAGGRDITPTLADLLVTQLTGAEKPPHENLSDREFQVLRLIASGKTVGQIAEELSLSSNTVSTYRARVLEKMRMKTNAELTHYAISNGLV